MLKIYFEIIFFSFLLSTHSGSILAIDYYKALDDNYTSDSLKLTQLIDQAKLEVSVNYKKAMSLALEANELALHTGDPELIMLTELNLGTLNFYLGLYENATGYFINILKIAEKVQNNEWMAKGYYQLGAIRLVMEDYNLAKTHFFKAKELFNQAYNDESLISLSIRLGFYNNLGVIYSGLGELELAKNEFEAGLALLNESSDLILVRTQLLNNIGDVYLKQRDPVTALLYFIQAKDQFQNVSDPRLEAMIDKSIGDTYLAQGETDNALFYYQQALKLANSFQGYSNLKHISKGLSEVYDQLGRKDSALVFLQLSKGYEDSLNLKKTSEKILKEEMLLAFSEEKSQLQQFYDGNRTTLQGIIISLLLVLMIGFLRAYTIRNKLKKVEIEQLKIGKIVNQTQQENLLLKINVEQSKKDMTLMSMNALQKDGILMQISESLFNKNKNGYSSIQEDLERMLSDLKINQKGNALNDFEFRFGNIYVGFFEKLLREYPSLSLNERRLCAFLKLQLTTKEISVITGQSVRAIEMARTRLRKKLALTNSEKNLHDFFLEF
jgi:tetratricopeptide (TPR) repeat protein